MPHSPFNVSAIIFKGVNKFALNQISFLFFLLAFISCVPAEQVELVDVRNLQIQTTREGPLLNGEVILYNPNKKKVKLKGIEIDLFVEGAKSAEVNQKFNQLILPEAEFSVPVEVHLSMKESDLVTTLFGLLGGKPYKILYKGYIRINKSGLPIRIPIDYEEEFRLNK